MKNLKKKLFGLAVCAMTFSSGAISGGTEIEIIFYETAAKQKVVGMLYGGCGTRPVMWGTRTSFHTVTTSPCVA